MGKPQENPEWIDLRLIDGLILEDVQHSSLIAHWLAKMYQFDSVTAVQLGILKPVPSLGTDPSAEYFEHPTGRVSVDQHLILEA